MPEPAERAHELAHERPIIHAADCDEHAQRRKRQPQDCPAPGRQLRYHTGDIYAADKAHGKRRRGNGGSGHHNAPCSKQDEKQYRSYRRKAEPDNDKRLACGLFCGCARFAEPGGKRRRIAEPCGDLLLGVAVGLELAQDGIDRAVGNVDALLQPVGYLVVVAVTLVQQCQHAQLEHALC